MRPALVLKVFVLIGLALPLSAWAAEPPPVVPLLTSKAGEHFTLEVRQVPAGAAGERAAELSIVPAAGYKVNLEYPTRVQLSATGGLTLPKPVLARSDAREMSKERARFLLPFVAPAGAKGELAAEVRFSVCNDRQCDLGHETLRWPAP